MPWLLPWHLDPIATAAPTTPVAGDADADADFGVDAEYGHRSD